MVTLRKKPYIRTELSLLVPKYFPDLSIIWGGFAQNSSWNFRLVFDASSLNLYFWTSYLSGIFYILASNNSWIRRSWLFRSLLRRTQAQTIIHNHITLYYHHIFSSSSLTNIIIETLRGNRVCQSSVEAVRTRAMAEKFIRYGIPAFALLSLSMYGLTTIMQTNINRHERNIGKTSLIKNQKEADFNLDMELEVRLRCNDHLGCCDLNSAGLRLP